MSVVDNVKVFWWAFISESTAETAKVVCASPDLPTTKSETLNPAPPKCILALSVNPLLTTDISAAPSCSKPPAVIVTGSPIL